MSMAGEREGCVQHDTRGVCPGDQILRPVPQAGMWKVYYISYSFASYCVRNAKFAFLFKVLWVSNFLLDLLVQYGFSKMKFFLVFNKIYETRRFKY